MTTTTNKTLRRVDKPVDAKGPIETLIDQRVKLEHALRWAEEHVQYKQDTLQAAMNRREKIKRDLALTSQIIANHTDKPHIEVVVNNATKGVVDAGIARRAFDRSYVPRRDSDDGAL